MATFSNHSLLSYISQLLLLHSLSFNGVLSFSACDEVDVVFLVDTDSIITNSEAVIKFITNVINSGSSEHSGFSVVIYGDYIPLQQKIKVISLHDTKSATQRDAAQKAVDNVLRKAYYNIKSISPATKRNKRAAAKASAPNNMYRHSSAEPLTKWERSVPESKESAFIESLDKKHHHQRRAEVIEHEAGKTVKSSAIETKSIDILPAFKIASGQKRPHHEGNRMLKLGYDPSDKSVMGQHDNQHVYIIFDHNNKLLRGGNNMDICALFHHLEHNEIRDEDESIYFMMGHHFDQGQIESIFCDNVRPKYIKKGKGQKRTFHQFTPGFAYNRGDMERIYCLTCPAVIKSPEYKGEIELGNHVQYLDLNTVMKCKLVYKEEEDSESRFTPKALDESKSYILVKDYINDDNTFTIDDKLISVQNIWREMEKLGCDSVVFITVKIVKDNDALFNTQDSDTSNDYQVLRLYVKIPENPMQYIQNANVGGTAKQHHFRKEANGEKKKKKYSEYDDYSPANEEEYNIYDDDYDIYAEEEEIKDEDKVWFDEVQILKGEMDHLLQDSDNTMLSALAHNILRDRAMKMKNVARKLSNFHKIKQQLIRKFPRHKRYVKSRRFAAKAMRENTAMNPFGISLTMLLLGQIKAHGEITLFQMGQEKEWSMTKMDNGEVEVIPDDLPPKWEISAWGEGQLQVRFGYLWKFSVGCKFKFWWQIFTYFIDITFLAFIEWDVGAFFYVQSQGINTMRVDNLFQFEKTIRFTIGPVPVILTPYVEIYVELESIRPEFFHGGVQCRYNERLYLGFRFCTIPVCIPHPISKKITKHKGCEKKLGIYEHIRERDYGEELQCPRQDINYGFDIRINVKIGCILYNIVNVFLRMEFVIPFRVHYPVMKASDCKYEHLHDNQDMCVVTKKTQYLKAHFWFSMHLNIYIGVSCDFMGILMTVLGIFGVPLPPCVSPEFEVKILGPIPIIPKISLGCMELKGAILELDTALRHSCCSANHYRLQEPKHPYYDKMYMDYYDTNYVDGNQNPYYDDPYYTDKGFSDEKHFNIHDPYHYNDDNEYQAQYYSPAYHFPVQMRHTMKAHKRHLIYNNPPHI